MLTVPRDARLIYQRVTEPGGTATTPAVPDGQYDWVIAAAGESAGIAPFAQTLSLVGPAGEDVIIRATVQNENVLESGLPAGGIIIPPRWALRFRSGAQDTISYVGWRGYVRSKAGLRPA